MIRNLQQYSETFIKVSWCVLIRNLVENLRECHVFFSSLLIVIRTIAIFVHFNLFIESVTSLWRYMSVCWMVDWSVNLSVIIFYKEGASYTSMLLSESLFISYKQRLPRNQSLFRASSEGTPTGRPYPFASCAGDASKTVTSRDILCSTSFQDCKLLYFNALLIPTTTV